MAQGARRQGRPDRRDPQEAGGRFSRRRVQLLAISAGQRGRGGVGRQRREFDQAVRQRSPVADRHRQQDQICAGDGAGRHRSRGVHVARPADGADRRRPRAGGALRPRARRHQRDDPHRDRRRIGRRPLRARQRPAFPDRGAPRAPVPAGPGSDSEPAHRRAGPQRHHPDSPERRRHRQAGDRRLLYLSRRAGALSADQVQRARSRPRQRDSGGATQGRRAGDRCRRAPGSNGSASSATCRTRSRGSRSWSRSASP